MPREDIVEVAGGCWFRLPRVSEEVVKQPDVDEEGFEQRVPLDCGLERDRGVWREEPRKSNGESGRHGDLVVEVFSRICIQLPARGVPGRLQHRKS